MNIKVFCVSDRPAFQVNTRCYSLLLMRTDTDFKWRWSRNEDTILSLDYLKAGYKTLQLNTILGNKAATQTTKGGNTDFYKAEGTGYKSKVLFDAHPDVTTLIERWGRPHHHIDYNKHFPDKTLIEDPNWIPSTPDPEYGLYLKDLSDNNYSHRCLI